jgi:CHAP domain
MIGNAALKIAQTQLGVSEMPVGSNDGPEVRKYLQSVGLGAGFAWCMAFVYWCVENAAKKNDLKNPLIKTGSVLKQYNETNCHKLPKTSRVIKPGDVFIMEFKKGQGHTGFVENIKGNVVNTIEGNTNDDGSREGYEVARRQRPLSSFKGFIQLN